jgi:transposase
VTAEERERVEKLERENEQLRKENERLRRLLEEALRKIKRQAGPFSRNKPKPNPKPPGRKKSDGQGRRGGHRPPKQPDEEHHAPLGDACPDCGGHVAHTETHEQWQEDLVRQTLWRLFHVEVGQCTRCGRRVQGRHPLQTSDALGAAAVQIGPEALAFGAELSKHMGLSHEKVARVLELGHGLSVSRSTICRALERMARKAQPTYRELMVIVRESRHAWMDETGWRVAASLRWLWMAATREVVLYSIRSGRGFAQAAAMLGKHFAGTLHHDGLQLYESFVLAVHQTCLAHLVRRCRALMEAAGTKAADSYAARVLAFLLHTIAVRARFDAGEITLHGMRVIAGQLYGQRLEPLLLEPPHSDEDRRLSNHLARQSPHLLTFLQDPEVDFTNNHAERMIRPAVVARKTWGGNRTTNGAWVQQTLMSILATYHLQRKDSLAGLVALQRSAGPMVLREIIPADST